MKQTKDQLETVVYKIKHPFFLEAVYLCSEILPDITTILNIIAICPATVLWLKEDSQSIWLWKICKARWISKHWALQCVFTIMMLIIKEADKIIDVWKRTGNKRIELWIYMKWYLRWNLYAACLKATCWYKLHVLCIYNEFCLYECLNFSEPLRFLSKQVLSLK